MKLFSIAAAAAITVIAASALSGESLAASFPPEYHGVWNLAGENATVCKKADWPDSRVDTMISITKSGIEYWESSCKPVTAKKREGLKAESAVDVELACGGEGMAWRSQDVFQIQKVDGRRQLIAISLKQYDWRNDSGRAIRQHPESTAEISVYTECN